MVHGDHRGRTIGFPTANVEAWDEQVIPANGVYACYVTLDDQRYRAVTNIGQRPTFDGTGERGIEAHLLDFDQDIYGQRLSVNSWSGCAANKNSRDRRTGCANPRRCRSRACYPDDP